MNGLRLALKIILPVLVLALGFGVFRALVAMRTPPPKKPPTEIAQPVTVVAPTAVSGPVAVRALGTLVPAREVALQAEVTGRIDTVAPSFVAGGRVAAGEMLVTLDRRDYWLALKQAGAQVKRAEVALKQEQSRKAVAEREWKLLGEQGQASARGRALALREPQIEGAEAEVEAAKSALDQARLAYQRTVIEAPFNAVVRSESVDVGQIARPGAALGTLVGSDTWWVQVALPAAELDWLDVPGSAATVVQDLGEGRVVRRRGEVVRQLPDVDPTGLMARVIVEVPDPLALSTADARPLLLGATVSVELAGRALDDVVALPREALRGEDAVWTVGEGDVLAIQPVEVARRERERVLVRGLAPGARVVQSRIAAPVPGMKLAPAGQPAGLAARAADGAEAPEVQR